jgi:hypothetical protein
MSWSSWLKVPTMQDAKTSADPCQSRSKPHPGGAHRQCSFKARGGCRSKECLTAASLMARFNRFDVTGKPSKLSHSRFQPDRIRSNPSGAGTNRLVQTSLFGTRLRTACSHHMKRPDAHADRGGDAFLRKDHLTFACSRRVCALRNHFRLR